MLKRLEDNFRFKIKTIQTDNGREFCNDREQKKSLFEKVMKKLGIEYIKNKTVFPMAKRSSSKEVIRQTTNYSTAEEDSRVKKRCTNHLRGIVQEPIIQQEEY